MCDIKILTDDEEYDPWKIWFTTIFSSDIPFSTWINNKAYLSSVQIRDQVKELFANNPILLSMQNNVDTWNKPYKRKEYTKEELELLFSKK